MRRLWLVIPVLLATAIAAGLVAPDRPTGATGSAAPSAVRVTSPAGPDMTTTSPAATSPAATSPAATSPTTTPTASTSPTTATTADTTATTTPPPTTTPTTTPTAPARATDGHRRVLIVGDSLVFDASLRLASTFAGHGVETRFVGHSGTGPLSGQGWWARDLATQVAFWQPDVVVIEACCNYMVNEPGFVASDGTTVAPDSAAMFEAWNLQAIELVRLARSRGADVLWVVTPDAGPQWPDAYRNRITHFNLIAATLGVTLLDWAKVLEPGGTYALAIPTPVGPVQVRNPDGLHVTALGDQLLADTTWTQIAAHLPPP